MIVPALAGHDECRRGAQVREPARFSPLPVSTAPAAPAASSTISAQPVRVQFSGSGPIRHVRLPGNTLQVRGQAVCASIKGTSVRAVLQSRQARRSLVPRLRLGHGLRLLRFPPSGRVADADGALRGAAALAASPGGADARGGEARAEVTARVETPPVESAKLEPVKSEPKAEAVRADQGRRCAGAAPLDRLIRRKQRAHVLAGY